MVGIAIFFTCQAVSLPTETFQRHHSYSILPLRGEEQRPDDHYKEGDDNAETTWLDTVDRARLADLSCGEGFRRRRDQAHGSIEELCAGSNARLARRVSSRNQNSVLVQPLISLNVQSWLLGCKASDDIQGARSRPCHRGQENKDVVEFFASGGCYDACNGRNEFQIT